MADAKQLSEEAKKKGNDALGKGDAQEAINQYSIAISHDAANHILYSNRSAAYVKQENYAKALEDANKAIEISPNWSKGYSRAGVAQFYLGNLADARKSYAKASELDPANEQLKKDLADVEAQLQQQQQGGAGGMGDIGAMLGHIFTSPQLWPMIATNPKLAEYAKQQDFVQIVNEIQKNPSKLQYHLKDKRIETLLTTLLGAVDDGSGMDAGPSEDEMRAQMKRRDEEERKKKEDEVKKKKDEEEAAKKKAEDELPDEKKKALLEKNSGNEFYKKKEFDKAIECYTKAIELDPSNINYLLNRSAAYYEKKDYEMAIADSRKAIEVGRPIYADFQLIARAYCRIGNSLTKQEKWAEAIEAYTKSLTENRTADALNGLKNAEKQEQIRKDKEYQDPTKAEEARQRGNDHFRNNRLPEAVTAYNEAIKRSPNDPVPLSNRAAALTKLGALPEAMKDCDKAIELDPNFVKAYIRKGHLHFVMKEYHRAMDTYEKGLKIDEKNPELQEGYQKVLMAVSSGANLDPEAKKRALEDPEIQQILADPMIGQVLKHFKENPEYAQGYWDDPAIRGKLMRLMAAGVIQMGSRPPSSGASHAGHGH